MPFRKLNIELKERMEDEGIINPLPFQEQIFNTIKSGKHVLAIAPKKSGKTIALVLNVIQRMLASKTSTNPRALIMVPDKAAALALESSFKDFMIMLDLDVFSVFDSQKIYNQKEAIYYGVDIVIATPERLFELYTETGINVKDLKMIVVEDADVLCTSKHMTVLEQIIERIPKCQSIILSDTRSPRIEELVDLFKELKDVKFVEESMV